MDREDLYRKLPKVDALLKRPEVERLCDSYPRWVVVESIRRMLEEKRRLIREGKVPSLEMDDLVEELKNRVPREAMPSLKRVINATGVVLHTNLGRAPLSREAIEAIEEVACWYSNLEYDLEAGERGLRYTHVVDVLKRLTGAPSVLVVNNNAAAVFLILNSLAKGKEVIVSRGELIEIGGSFRIPDVMRAAGAVLREVGTTNKTRIEDYRRAISENTALILKVHTSNYRIVGFTESVPLKELVKLGKEYGIPVYEDLGSGLFIDVRRFGLPYEPTVQESLRSGADLVSFSGDKLLGSTQAGIILGREDLVEVIRKNPINRVLRIDKLTLAGLEATMRLYLEGEDEALKKIPVLRMLAQPAELIRKRAELLIEKLSDLEKLSFDLVEDVSTVGGGALPTAQLPTFCVAITGRDPEEIDELLRVKPVVPVVGRIKDERFLLDMRTVRDEEVDLLARSVREALS